METVVKRRKKSKVRTAPKPTIKNPANLLGKVRFFRWLKKSMSGKSRAQSMDLLDQWILRKRPMSLFF